MVLPRCVAELWGHKIRSALAYKTFLFLDQLEQAILTVKDVVLLCQFTSLQAAPYKLN